MQVVSIVSPASRGAAFPRAALASALPYTPWPIVVAKDVSGDATLAVAYEWGDWLD
jgi:hypothetical protein